MHPPQSTATRPSQRDAATPQDDLMSSFVEIRIDRLYPRSLFSSVLEIMVGSGDAGAWRDRIRSIQQSWSCRY